MSTEAPDCPEEVKFVSPEEASTPTKPLGAGTVDVATTVVDVVLVVVVKKTLVVKTLLVDVYVEVVENVLVTVDAVVVTCARFWSQRFSFEAYRGRMLSPLGAE